MKLKRTEQGTAMIELALVLPLFLAVVLAIIEWGAWLYDQAVITNVSDTAARAVAASNPKLITAQIQPLVLSTTQDSTGKSLLVTFSSAAPPPQATAKVNAPVSNTACPLGTASSVTVQYIYTGLVLGPMFSNIVGTLPQPSATTVICDE